MGAQDTGPLDWRIAIVDKNGRPTPEFQRRWQTQRFNNALIGTITFANGPPTGTPEDGAEYVDTSTTPYTFYIGNGGTWHQVSATFFTDLLDVPHTYVPDNLVQVNPGGTGLQFTPLADFTDDPSAVASDVAVNGSATTFMRSDAAPAVQKATDSQFGVVQVDGVTITETSGIISAVSSGGGGLTWSGPSAGGGFSNDSGAFATKGNQFSPAFDVDIHRVMVPIGTVTIGDSIQCAIFPTNSNGNSLTGVALGTATVTVTASPSLLDFVFSSPVTLTGYAAGVYTYYAVLITNLSTTTTTILNIYSGTGQSPFYPDLAGVPNLRNLSLHLASNAPASGDSPSVDFTQYGISLYGEVTG